MQRLGRPQFRIERDKKMLVPEVVTTIAGWLVPRLDLSSLDYSVYLPCQFCLPAY